jgi:hypothetical protein
VLVSLDLGWWRSFHDEWALRGHVLNALGLDGSRLMIHLTHTHSGPVLCRGDADKPGGQLIAPYLDFLAESVVGIVREALSSGVSGTLEWSSGRCDMARNRDMQDPKRPRILCGFNPSGPADDTLLVGRASGDNGRCLATLVNYACHPTTLAWENRLISPDWVGAMREVVEARSGDSPCLYLHGAAGELAPREQYTDDTAAADKHGRQVGFAVVSVLEGMLPPATALVYDCVKESGAPLALWKSKRSETSTRIEALQIDVHFALKALPALAELSAQIADCRDRVQSERLLRKRRIREGVGDGTTTSMPAWIWRAGDALIVGHPNEAYSGLQVELRRRFPKTAIAVMNVVNGHFGYLPPGTLFERDGYAVWQSPFAAGCLEQLIESCSAAISALGK